VLNSGARATLDSREAAALGHLAAAAAMALILITVEIGRDGGRGYGKLLRPGRAI